MVVLNVYMQRKEWQSFFPVSVKEEDSWKLVSLENKDIRAGHGTIDWFKLERSMSRVYIVTMLI